MTLDSITFIKSKNNLINEKKYNSIYLNTLMDII